MSVQVVIPEFIKTGFRKSDGAEMAMIELVDFNELLLGAKKSGGAKKKKTRRRGKKSKSAAAGAAAAAATAEVVETLVEDSTPETSGEEE